MATEIANPTNGNNGTGDLIVEKDRVFTGEHSMESNNGIFRLNSGGQTEYLCMNIRYTGKISYINYYFSTTAEHIEYNDHFMREYKKEYETPGEDKWMILPISNMPVFNGYIEIDIGVTGKSVLKYDVNRPGDRLMTGAVVQYLPSKLNHFGAEVKDDGTFSIFLNDFSRFIFLVLGCEDEEYRNYEIINAEYLIDGEKVSDIRTNGMHCFGTNDQVYDRTKTYKVVGKIKYDREKLSGMNPMVTLGMYGYGDITRSDDGTLHIEHQEPFSA